MTTFLQKFSVRNELFEKHMNRSKTLHLRAVSTVHRGKMHPRTLSCMAFLVIILSSSPVLSKEAGNDFALFMPAIFGTGQRTAVPGNPNGGCPVPAEAREDDSSAPDQIIGNGSPQSCTSEAVVTAVAKGGVITFNCGPAPVTITMKQTAKIVNNTGPEIVIDGGGKVTLSGNNVTLSLCGTRIENNSAREGGGAIFFVCNDRSGSLLIKDSYLSDNPSGGFETAGYPGIFVLADGDPVIINSTIK